MKKNMLLWAAVLCCIAARGQQIVVDNFEQLRLSFDVSQPAVGTTILDGQPFSTLSLDGYLATTEAGSPALPVWSRLIEVPLCESFAVEVTEAVFDTFALPEPQLMPSQPSRRKSDTVRHPLSFNKAIYQQDVFLGETLALVEEVGICRDRRLARLQFAPVRYNPVRRQLAVCRKATVTVHYTGANREASLALFRLHHSPFFASGAQSFNSLYPKSVRTTAPVRLLIVANSMFRGYLDEFVQWKQRKGFRTDVVYTDNPAVGTTTTSIAAYIKSLYTNASLADPAPTYVLLVGDVAQLPAFSGITDDEHVTDLYYMSWTAGDDIPDCHYGRFSAQMVSELTPQIEKTLMYEQYTFADPSFLDRAVLVAGVDGGSTGDYGYTHADPAMDYAVTNYINGAHGFSDVHYFKNNTSIVPSDTSNVTIDGNASSMSATVRSFYNQGAGFINYSAHGSSTSWSTPNFTTSHASSMTNTQKFGLMIGNCCLTNRFQTPTCLGEALLRKGNYCGAVGYIGGSNSTYWYDDFYWAVGVRSSIGPTMSMAYDASHPGVYDLSFHTHNEDYANWCTTQGSMVMQGNMAVQSSTSSHKLYYWEIYHLMGDPSVMPYLTQASVMTLSHASTVTVGTETLAVTAAPHAYVALVDTTSHSLLATAYADSAGNVSLALPTGLPVGTYLLAASAQQYRTAFSHLTVILPSGPYPYVTAVTPQTLVAGDTVTMTLLIANPGNATAHNVGISLASVSPLLTLYTSALHLDSLPAGSEATMAVNAYVSDNSPDDTLVALATATTWTGNTSAINAIHLLTLYAPVVTIAFSNTLPGLLPAATATVNATLHNRGHAPTTARLMLTSPTSLFSATVAAGSTLSLEPGSQASVTLTLHADSRLPQHIIIPLCCCYGRFCDTLPVFIGTDHTETFEDGITHLAGWQNTTNYPWTPTATHAYEGAYSFRSSAEATHNTTSDATLTVSVATADSMSFYYRVSSESGFDKFHFLVDGTSVLEASGEVDWSRASYLLSAGSHTLTFRYAKDRSVNDGNDCAWVDAILLPHTTHAVSFLHGEACVGDVLTVDGQPVDTEQPGSSARCITAANGDITLVDYIIHPTYNVTENIVGCDSLLWQDILYTTTTVLTDTLLSAFGCDSIVGLTLTVNHASRGDTLRIATAASSFEWYGIVYTAAGTYSHTLINSQGCDSIVTLVLSFGNTQGIDDAQIASPCVYPNPTTGWIHFGQIVDNATLFDVTGRLVKQGRLTNALDLGDLAPGVYTLRLATQGNYAVLRIVKQ